MVSAVFLNLQRSTFLSEATQPPTSQASSQDTPPLENLSRVFDGVDRGSKDGYVQSLGDLLADSDKIDAILAGMRASMPEDLSAALEAAINSGSPDQGIAALSVVDAYIQGLQQGDAAQAKDNALLNAKAQIIAAREMLVPEFLSTYLPVEEQPQEQPPNLASTALETTFTSFQNMPTATPMPTPTPTAPETQPQASEPAPAPTTVEKKHTVPQSQATSLTLPQLTERAEKAYASYSRRQTQANVEAAFGQYGSLTRQPTFTGELRVDFSPGSGAAPNGDVGVSYRFVNPQLDARRGLAFTGLNLARLNAIPDSNSIYRLVGDAYLSRVALTEERFLRTDERDTSKLQLRDANQLFTQGLGSPAKVSSAKKNVLSTEQALNRVTINEAGGTVEINKLIGQTNFNAAVALPRLAENTQQLRLGADPDLWLNAAQFNNVNIRAAEIKVQQAEAVVAEVRAEGKPKVDAFAQFGVNGQAAFDAQLGIRASLTPNSANAVPAAQAKVEHAKVLLEQTRVDTDTKVKLALNALRESEGQNGSLDRAHQEVLAASEALQTVTLEWKQGTASYDRVLDASNRLTEAKINEVKAKIEYGRAILALYEATYGYVPKEALDALQLALHGSAPPSEQTLPSTPTPALQSSPPPAAAAPAVNNQSSQPPAVAPTTLTQETQPTQSVSRMTAKQIEGFSVKLTNAAGDVNGSGIIVKREGDTYYVLTNAHVIRETNLQANGSYGDRVTVVLPDGTKTTGRLIAPTANALLDSSGKQPDLALVAFDSDQSYSVARLRATEVPVGTQVFHAGFPAEQLGDFAYLNPATGFAVNPGTIAADLDDGGRRPGSRLEGNYELESTGITHKGQSGGAVVAIAEDGTLFVVGMNGASADPEVNFIPLSTLDGQEYERVNGSSDSLIIDSEDLTRFLNAALSQ